MQMGPAKARPASSLPRATTPRPGSRPALCNRPNVAGRPSTDRNSVRRGRNERSCFKRRGEVALCSLVYGKQDQYAAAYGGLNFIEFINASGSRS